MPVTTIFTCDKCGMTAELGRDAKFDEWSWFTVDHTTYCPSCRKELLTYTDVHIAEFTQRYPELFSEGTPVVNYRKAVWLYSKLVAELVAPRNALYPDGKFPIGGDDA